MEFWGVEVKPGQVLKVKPEDHKFIHISQASLSELKNKEGPEYVPLRLRFPDGCKFLIGSLAVESPQMLLDLVFEKEFELSHGWKDGSVPFLGYIAKDDEYSSDASDTHESTEEEPELPKIRIFLKSLDGTTHTLKVRSSDTIISVKNKLMVITGLAPDMQRFIFTGKQLEDGRTLASYNTLRESTIHLIQRLCGC